MDFIPIEKDKKYNEWTIKSEPFKKNGIYYVNAQCSCGKLKEVKKNNILSERSKSCGCKTRENLVKLSTGKSAWNSKPIEDLAKRELYEQYKHSAKSRNYEFNLTKEQFNLLIDSECKYCGNIGSNCHTVNNKKGNYNYNGIDRINNDLGYEISNVVTSCKDCNKMKNDLKIENFFEHIQKIIKNNQVKPGINVAKLDYYYGRALETAENSHDSETKVGAILINNESGAVIAEGYNGFVRNAPDDKLPTTRPDKYPYMIHAEQNLICNAVRNGIRTENCTLFCTLSPCKTCIRLLYQAGITTIYFKDVYGDLEYSKNMGDLDFDIEVVGEFYKLKYKVSK